MGYDPDRLVLRAQAGADPARDWLYTDTRGEAASVYVAAGYFTTAGDLGVKVNDNIRIYDRTNNSVLDGYFSVAQDTGATQGTVVLDTD